MKTLRDLLIDFQMEVIAIEQKLGTKEVTTENMTAYGEAMDEVINKYAENTQKYAV